MCVCLFLKVTKYVLQCFLCFYTLAQGVELATQLMCLISAQLFRGTFVFTVPVFWQVFFLSMPREYRKEKKRMIQIGTMGDNIFKLQKKKSIVECILG